LEQAWAELIGSVAEVEVADQERLETVEAVGAPKNLENRQILLLFLVLVVLVWPEIVSIVYQRSMLARCVIGLVPHMPGLQEKQLHVFVAGDRVLTY
jgi:hypothetical protein